MPCAACLMLWQWSVQMHGMDFVAAIVDVHHYHVALAYHIHGDVGVEAAVDGPPHARPTFDEAWSATDPIFELARGVDRIEAEWCRRAVRQQIELGGGLRQRSHVGCPAAQ